MASWRHTFDLLFFLACIELFPADSLQSTYDHQDTLICEMAPEPLDVGPKENFCLFEDLALVDQINKELKDTLPFFYNYSFMGGYFNTPSARMQKSGMFAIGGGRVPPYNIYGVNFQILDRIELSGNYRVFTGVPDSAMGKDGFGDQADRVGNIKIAILAPEDGFPLFPRISFGADDFFGGKHFNSQYVVATKEWTPNNVEFSLGWSHGRMKGFFGGIAWTPLRQSGLPVLKDISLVAEYDPTNYKHHCGEHPEGRSFKTRFNGGVIYNAWNLLQFSVSSVRGEKVAAAASLRYPLGLSKGLLPKINDPITYRSPVDTEPLGVCRPDKEFAQELVYAFSDQGLDLYSIYLTHDIVVGKKLWLKVVNNRYREESVVRERIEHLLAALVPSDVIGVSVVIEAVGLPSHSYYFRNVDLIRYRTCQIDSVELAILSPMKEVVPYPKEESSLLFHRKKAIWTFTIEPRVLTFFGSAKGKFKYDVGVIASPEGYLFDEVYYKFQVGYSIKSSTSNLSATDRINPSHLFNVRTDTIRYYQTNTVSMEQAYVQKAWNLGKGVFGRLALGYFEPAYGGIAGEALFFPVKSDWAIGAEWASVFKRRYQGIGFTTKVRKVEGHIPVHKHFIGLQYFLDLYYTFRPLELQFKISAGQFLAKDKGVRTEVSRYFANGLRVSLWYTITNAHDKVNGSTYHDKGVAFYLPLDLFLKQSSRNYIGYVMSAWLRDVGAQAENGKPLFPTLYEERYDP